MTTGSPLLEVRSAAKRFGSATVLSSVDFSVIAGEVHVLAGENGAGKSTLMRILSGVYSDYGGQLICDGREVRFNHTSAAREAGIVMIHQELSLVPELSVIDNIFLGRELSKNRWGWLDRKRQHERARASLRQLGIDIDPVIQAGELPLATQQLVEVAKALTFEANVIIFDEPTSALNRPEAERLIDLVQHLRDAGKGIVYCTHKMEEIYRLADRITILRDGHLISTTQASTLPREQLVRDLVGRDVSEQYPPRSTIRSAQVVLELENFGVPGTRRGAPPIVDCVSLSLHRGEILGIAGLEGSGNHELMRGLFGHGLTTTGSVRIETRDIEIKNPTDAIRNGIAFVTNDRKGDGLILDLDIVTNITLASLPAVSPGGWLRPEKEREVASRYAREMKLRHASLGQSVQSLSGGNQQKVLLAKWLAPAPKVLLLDDPTRGVDIGAKREIYLLMRRWAREGMAILLLSSELPELLALSDRVLVMHRGRIGGEFAGNEIAEEAVMRCALGEASTRDATP